MGRPEQLLASDGTPAMEFAVWMRDAKRRSDLTYEQIAKRAGYAVTTVQEACAGRRLPTLKVTQAIARACGVDEQAWAEYWAVLHQLQDRRDAAPLGAVPPPPWAVIDLTDPAPSTPAKVFAEPLAESEEVPAPRLRSPFAHWPRATSVWLTGLVVLALVVAGAVLLVHRHVRGAATGGLLEQEYNRSGVATFADPHTPAGAEARIPFQVKVRVLCKVLAPSIGSVSPDGYWYKIASRPWAGSYAPANTFLNGDKPAGPYTHSTDWRLPNC
jgi:transcriptional regulator with XRE-family HTH domain